MRFQVLGPLAAKDPDRGAVELGPRRQRMVLARLLVAGGGVVPAERIIEELWPDDQPVRALGTLQSYVSHLRRALEPDRPPRAPANLLVSASPGYALRAQVVDARLFEEEVRAADQSPNPDEALHMLDQALGRWLGPAYADVGDQEWARPEILRLNELRAHAVERRAARLLETGQPAVAAGDLEAFLAAEPLREESWRLLAIALYRMGRQGEALGALRRARTMLADELGVDPGPGLRDVETAILAQDPVLDAVPQMKPLEPVEPPQRAAAPPEAVPSPGNVPDTGLFGRANDLEQLTRTAQAAEAGRRLRTALVHGEPGIGKTALLEVLAVGLATAGWRVAWGRCPEAGGAPPLWPWHQVITTLVGEPPSAADRFQTSRAVSDRFARTADSRPVAVLLDDLHIADEGTLAVLRDVLGGPPPAMPVLVVGTYRSAEVSGPLADTLAVFSRQGALRLPLGPLPDADAAALVRAVQAEEGTADRVDPGAVASIVERAGGNPFYLRELARLPVGAPEDAAYTPPPAPAPPAPPPPAPPPPAPADATAGATAGAAEPEAEEVPAGIAEVIRLRIARLPALTRNVLRVVAVIGREADVRLVVAAQRQDPDDVYDALEAAVVGGLLEEPAAGRVRFAHVLVRDTVYGDLLRLRRARLHADVGAATERIFPGALAELAHHFSEAAVLGESDKAVRYCRAAAEAAENAFAYASALDLWERALAAFDRDGMAGDPRIRTELLIGRARAAQLAGRPRWAHDLRGEAIHAAEAIGDPELTARAIVAIDTPTLWYSRPRGQIDIDLIQLIRRTLPAVPDALKAGLRTTYALEAGLHHDPDGAVEAATAAVEWAREAGETTVLAAALNALYFAERRPGRYAEVTRVALELERLGRDERMPGVEALGLLARCVELGAQGELDKIASLTGAVAELADRYELPVFRMQVQLADAARELVQGDLDTAGQSFAALAETAASREMWDVTGAGVIGRLCARQAAGDIASAEQDARLIASFDAVVGTPMHACTIAARGDAEAAFTLLRKASEPPSDQLWLLLEGFRADALTLAAAAAPGSAPDAKPGSAPDAALDAEGHNGPASPRELAGPLYERLLPYEPFVCGGETMGLHLGPVAARLARLAGLLGLPKAVVAGHWEAALALARRARAPRWQREAETALERLNHRSS
ncbi:BTAD domain-containing putative transcriptional regulator [Actinomadura rudentiformis]|uniref:AAA family ATPase n=1 Tax=Actinomadura rudentiformis TaxID=359158 RepID=A0A6H9YYR5_9ACTN|nr:BTAD domain-containing putative transcriptional regulator [Actinomadura rudentiformis]KAB2347877.1 AAA family ATPase [Actinomadura rudentiformis]